MLSRSLSIISRIGRLEGPEFIIKEVVILAQYPEATAKEVEMGITKQRKQLSSS